MFAALGGNYEMVKFLVEEAGADVNAVNNRHENALLIAHRSYHTDVVNFLIHKTRNTNGLDKVLSIIILLINHSLKKSLSLRILPAGDRMENRQTIAVT